MEPVRQAQPVLLFAATTAIVHPAPTERPPASEVPAMFPTIRDVPPLVSMTANVGYVQAVAMNVATALARFPPVRLLAALTAIALAALRVAKPAPPPGFVVERSVQLPVPVMSIVASAPTVEPLVWVALVKHPPPIVPSAHAILNVPVVPGVEPPVSVDNAPNPRATAPPLVSPIPSASSVPGDVLPVSAAPVRPVNVLPSASPTQNVPIAPTAEPNVPCPPLLAPQADLPQETHKSPKNVDQPKPVPPVCCVLPSAKTTNPIASKNVRPTAIAAAIATVALPVSPLFKTHRAVSAAYVWPNKAKAKAVVLL